MTVEMKIYDSFESLKSIQAQWDAFVESVGCEIFMTYDWQRIWWKYYGKGRLLKIFIFRSNEQLVGIIPMFFEKTRLGPVSIRYGKMTGTDFTIYTVNLPIHREFCPDVIKMFLTEIKTCCQWDLLHIGPLSGLYGDFGNLADLCGQYMDKGCRVKTANSQVQTFFLLADSEGKPAELIPRRRARQLGQKYRALQRALGAKATVLISRFANGADFEETFENFVGMHQQLWQKQHQAGHFGDWPAALEFHREMALTQLKLNRLRLMEIKSDGRLLGYEYAYKFGDTLVELLNARIEDEHLASTGLGNINFYELIKHAREEQIRYIDSLRGRYEHKLRMGGTLFDINNIYISHDKSFAWAKVYVFRVLAWLLDVCYYKIWYSRLAPKLPLRRGPLWEIWIRTNAFAWKAAVQTGE